MTLPKKQDVLGTGVSAASIAEIVEALVRRRDSQAVVVNVCNVHSVMSARRDPVLAAALAAGGINTPDGMPLVWFLRSRGYTHQTRVKGSELAAHAFGVGLDRQWRHFFYGTTDLTLARLTDELERRFPGIQICGCHAPPFRALDPTETADLIEMIQRAKPDIIWVGLGMPKQEKWMHEIAEHFPGTVLVGIGAAFDFLAGTKAEAPKVMQRLGLEWLFRLGAEPRRLWRRYAWNNPLFLALWAHETLRRGRGRP